jgi:Holliday junction resolvase RusA-like endonuclease
MSTNGSTTEPYATITVPGEPVPWMRSRGSGARRFTDPRDRAHRALVALYATQAMAQLRKAPMNSYMRLDALFYITPPASASKANKARMLAGHLRPTSNDIDNLLKSVMDALRGVSYTDDRLIVELGFIAKLYSENPRTEIRIYKL